MKYPVFSLRDKVASSFQSVNLDTNDFVAKRNFAFAVNNSNELLFKAKDLELYKVGEFDTDTGIFEGCSPLIRICSGDEVVNNEKEK